ncbi:sensor histidine kinase [Bizionia argentinensis JUB59]|uniref:histidine kinase n=1 Tax=Bizionia argentinensis JUB59 TaxID=1046627 RepID=G2ED05_9FLAO|nr:GAF domain-containing sensor histidine kinase [Bizionia argentinensis]EGV43734.1 sensor histidine kinase [Bizionia argentinensis JUB59]
MISPEILKNETNRLNALKSYDVLDTLPEKEYDEITALASMICNTPMSLVSLIDNDRQWFKSNHGMDITETPREFAFCAHAINKKGEMLIVNDARQDERFKNNPFVTGDPNVVFYAGMPLVSPDGYPLGTLCVFDVESKVLSTEQKNALEFLSNQIMNLLELRKNTMILHQNNLELNAKNKILDNFVSIAAHDIKAPMNNVLALSNMLIEDFSNTMEPEAVQIVKYIHTSVQQSTHLIDGILNYSIDKNAFVKDKEPIHLKSFLTDIKEAMVTGNNIQITTDVDPNLNVLINKTALTQVFSNLITNSIKYGNKDIVKIHIQVTEKESQLIISVKDNGPGIPLEEENSIFEPFSTTSNIDNDGFHGTGIGLATVKSLVETLGGEISVVSKVNEGANFVFSLQKN